MPIKHLTLEELGVAEMTPEHAKIMSRWLERGDGIAVYENHDLGHPGLGSRKFVSFGSAEAQIEALTPPTRLPDIGGDINWRFTLIGVYQGPPFAQETVQFGTLHPDGSVRNQRAIKQSDILACPYVIMMPEHYREDGSCRCDDPEHTEMSEWGYHWDEETKQWTA